MMGDKLLLAIDVGNTNTTIGLFEADKLRLAFKLPSSMEVTTFWGKLKEQLSMPLDKITKVAISSVVKGKGEELEASLKDHFFERGVQQPFQVMILGPRTRWPMKSMYKGNLGTDRILAAIAGAKIYGIPVIVIDIGSAVTIDLIDDRGIFIGGIILAGAEMRIRALAEFTSALPRIPIPKDRPSLIGNSTIACMSSGIYHGMRKEIEGLVSAIQEDIGKTGVVVTGQGNQLFKNNTPSGWQLDDWLVIKGIYYTVAGNGSVLR